jgi:nucleotide-binding universal stress UspA family protein
MPRIKKILAPTDFSDLSKVGLRYALEMARDESAEVIAYHVIDFSADWSNRHRDYGPNWNWLAGSRHILDKFLAENFADCIDLAEVRQVVEFGAPHKNIVEVAAREGVDMIVMSTHGRTGLDHFIMGSVAEKVLARAPCPVLILPRRAGEGVTVRAKIPNIETVFASGETNHVTRNILRWTVECPIAGSLAKAEIATTRDPQSSVRFFEITDCSLWGEKGYCEQTCINRPVATRD